MNAPTGDYICKVQFLIKYMPLLISRFCTQGGNKSENYCGGDSCGGACKTSCKNSECAVLRKRLSHALAHKKTKSADRHTCACSRKINKRFVQSECPEDYACDNKARKYSCGSEFCFVNENLTCHADQSANPECIYILHTDTSFVLSLSINIVPSFW